MMTKYIIPALLLLSLTLNCYLYLQSSKWQTAWVEQFVTTSEIESMLRELAPDVSYGRIAKDVAGAVPIEATAEAQRAGLDPNALQIGSTTLLFKKGYYAGSKAALPDH
ncbi:hypothetical protein [uncultured Thalassolituus sp.]|uniref:hypothetical protein n=1 Tax=uncultured Thalassolituus sp. TaxID=285273 RepID=UPI0026174D69|nr:hypothetical protein [uncultured Thalassolituus sp.]